MTSTREEKSLDIIRSNSYLTMRYLGGFDHVDIHEEWHTYFKTVPSWMLEAPRGHAKTTIFVYYIPWLIGTNYNDPELFIKYFGCSVKEASKRVQAIAKIILSAKYKKLFPHVRPDMNNWSKTSLRFKTPHIATDPQVEALGFTSAWTGSRGKYGFFDDVVDFESSLSVETMDRFEQKFDADADNILLPEAFLFYIYTTWTDTDLSSRLKKRGILPVFEYNYRNYEDDGKLLWESYWTKEAIEKKRNENPTGWKQGFLLLPLTSDLRRIFFREYFHFMDNIDLSNVRPDLSLDLATGSGQDDSAISIIYNLDGFKYFHDIRCLDLKINDLIKMVVNQDLHYNFRTIWFESNAFQKVFGDLVPENIKWKCKGSNTTKPKKEDVNTGLEAFAGQMENRKVIFNPNISEDIILQFIEYPFHKHDDAVMSAWQGWCNQFTFKEGKIF